MRVGERYRERERERGRAIEREGAISADERKFFQNFLFILLGDSPIKRIECSVILFF